MSLYIGHSIHPLTGKHLYKHQLNTIPRDVNKSNNNGDINFLRSFQVYRSPASVLGPPAQTAHRPAEDLSRPVPQLPPGQPRQGEGEAALS